MEENSIANTAPKKRRPRIGAVRLALSTVVLLTAMVIWAAFIGGRLKAEEVISNSMSPTIEVGDRLVIAEIEDKPIERGDIVMIESIDSDPIPLIKRVVAVPGDTVWVINYRVFVNRMPNFVELKRMDAWPISMTYKIAVTEDHYFVAGDNWRESYDSRFFGPVARRKIIGKALFCYAPVDRIGPLDKQAPRN